MRSATELHAECAALGIEVAPDASRIAMMDAIRQELGSFDASLELDPMKAKDLKHEIDWTKSVEDGRYDGIAKYLKPGWFAEPKLDGCRMRLFLGLAGNTMNTGRRSVKTFRYQNRTDNFPHLRDAVLPDLAGTVLDGEICANAKPDQSLLNESVALCNSSPERAVMTQTTEGPASFYVFDVMFLNGEDVTKWTYSQRRAALVRIVELFQITHPECQIKIVDSRPATVEFIEQCLEAGFEGAMLKNDKGPYQFGKRSPHWLKVKAFSTGDFFITGYEPGNGAFTGLVGSICFSVHDQDGNVFEAGKFGNIELEQRKFMTAPDGSLHVCWYNQVVEIMAQARTKTDRLRHAHLVRFRPDKVAEDCQWDQLMLFGKA